MDFVKNNLLLLILMTYSLGVYAQQKEYHWSLGVSYGYSNYYGDLTPVRFQGVFDTDALRHVLDYNPYTNLGASYQISIERHLNKSVSVYARYGFYDVSMNDRFTDKNGNLWLEAPNFDRGLNFRNQSRDFGFGFSFKTANDRLLPSTALIAPYMNLGMGLLDFKVFGNLKDANGLLYDFSLPNLNQNQHFETNLHTLETEEPYDLQSFYANLGLGLRVRLSSRIEVFLQTDILRSFTNHLDDVAGQYRSDFSSDLQAHASNPTRIPVQPTITYRGNPDNRVDWIINHGAGVRLNFGHHKKSFVAPQVIPLRTFAPLPIAKTPSDEEALLPWQEKTTPFLSSDEFKATNEQQLIKQAHFQLIDREIIKKQKEINSLDSSQTALKAFRKEYEEQNQRIRSRLIANKLPTEQFEEEASRQTKKLFSSIDSVQLLKNRGYFKIDSLLAEKSRIYQRELSIAESKIDSLATIKELQDSDLLFEHRFVGASEQTQKSEVPTSEKTKQAILTPVKTTSTSGNQPSVEKSSSEQSLDAFYLLEIQRLNRENAQLRQQSTSNMSTSNSSQNPRVIVNETRNPRKDAKVMQKEERKLAKREERKDGRLFLGGLFAGAAINEVLSNDDIKKDSITIQHSSTPDAIPFLPSTFKPEESIPDRLAWVPIELPKLEDWMVEGGSAYASTGILQDSLAMSSMEINEKLKLIPSREFIYFDINQRIPSESELQKLRPLITFLEGNPEYTLSITGFADNTGSLPYNLKLAADRSRAVGEAITLKFGIPPSRLKFMEGGKIVRGSNQQKEASDRRVEVLLIFL